MHCVRIQNARERNLRGESHVSNILKRSQPTTYPAIITVPPSGVIGPNHLNLQTLNQWEGTPGEKLWEVGTNRSRASTKAKMLPEKTTLPRAMAGPANRWAAKRGCRDISINPRPLKICNKSPHYEQEVSNADGRLAFKSIPTVIREKNCKGKTNAPHSGMPSPRHECCR